MTPRKSFSLLTLGAVFAACVSVNPAAAAQRCQGGVMVDDQTGKPVIYGSTGKPVRCDFYGQDASTLSGDNTGLLAFGGAVAAAGVLGGLCASGTICDNNNSTPFLPAVVFPPAGPVSGQ